MLKKFKEFNFFKIFFFSFNLFFFYSQATSLSIDFGAGILFAGQTLEEQSNSVLQHQGRVITNREHQDRGGFSLAALLSANNHFVFGLGMGFFQASIEHTAVSISALSQPISSNVHQTYFPIWAQAEYFLKPRTDRFNLSFTIKGGLVPVLLEYFQNHANVLSVARSWTVTGGLIVPSVKLIYGLKPFSQVYLDFQYTLIISPYFRHHPYLGIGTRYTIDFPKPKKATNDSKPKKATNNPQSKTTTNDPQPKEPQSNDFQPKEATNNR